MPNTQPPPPPPSASTTPPRRAGSSAQPTLGELIARISENISALVRGEIVPMALIGIKRLKAAKADTPTPQEGLMESVNAVKGAVASGLERGNAK